MPNEITKNTTQSNQPEPTANEMAAALAFATRLSEGLLPQAPPEPPQTQEIAPPQGETPESDKTPQEQDQEAKTAKMGEMMDKMVGMMDEMKSMMDEIRSMKKETKETAKE